MKIIQRMWEILSGQTFKCDLDLEPKWPMDKKGHSWNSLPLRGGG